MHVPELVGVCYAARALAPPKLLSNVSPLVTISVLSFYLITEMEMFLITKIITLHLFSVPWSILIPVVLGFQTSN